MEECKHGLTEDTCSVCRHGPTPPPKTVAVGVEPKVWRDHGVLLPEVEFDAGARPSRRKPLPPPDPSFPARWPSPCPVCGERIIPGWFVCWAATPRDNYRYPPVIHKECRAGRSALEIEWVRLPEGEQRRFGEAPDDFWSRADTPQKLQRIERKRAKLRKKYTKSWTAKT